MKGHVGLLDPVHLGPECLLLTLEGLVGLARLVKAVVLGHKYLTLTASKAECKQDEKALVAMAHKSGRQALVSRAHCQVLEAC